MVDWFVRNINYLSIFVRFQQEFTLAKVEKPMSSSCITRFSATQRCASLASNNNCPVNFDPIHHRKIYECVVRTERSTYTYIDIAM